MKEETNKQAFQRIWNEEDEIVLLQGMIDFNVDTGKDSNGLYEFIQKSISFEVSKNQFMDKIRSLKKKYFRKEINSVEPSSLKAHDQKSYELSKLIWGPQELAFVSKKSQRKKNLDSVKQEMTFVESHNDQKDEDEKKVLVQDWFENSFLGQSIAVFGADEHYVKQGWSLVTVENKKKLEDKFEALQEKELQNKLGLLHEATLMIIEASKNKP